MLAVFGPDGDLVNVTALDVGEVFENAGELLAALLTQLSSGFSVPGHRVALDRVRHGKELFERSDRSGRFGLQ
jgi:hypothetical protein